MIIPLSLLITAMAAAQPADKGYVVKVDSASVWIDLTAADGAAVGRPFEVYVEGEELKHPVTGASLGRVQTPVAQGRVADISDKFSTGVLSAHAAEVKAGQRARFTAQAPVAPVAKPTTRNGEPESRAAKTEGITVDYQITAMTVGDFDGVHKPQIVLSSEDSFKLYPYPLVDPKPIAEATIVGTGARILGLESADLEGTGRTALFVSVFDDTFKRFETRVYKLEAGKWLKSADLPFLTRTYQDPTGKRVLLGQQVVDDKSFPLGAIYPVVFQDGKYSLGRPALGIHHADWLFNFTTAQLGAGKPALLYLTNVHALRVQFGKESWRTPDEDYGQTPIRIRWQDRLMEFNPPFQVTYGAKGFEALYAVRNLAALGGLATPFGMFNRSELVRKRWNGLGLETEWKAELPGCAQGMAVIDTPSGREVLVGVRGSAGQSSVWTFEP